jgi:hypothetical protein
VDDELEKMVWTRYKNEKGFVTSIKLSKANSDFIKERFGNRTRWIQEQHDKIIGKFRQKNGITEGVSGCPRKQIHNRIIAAIMELRWDDAELM